MLVEFILGALGEEVIGHATRKGLQLFKSAQAKTEISEIGAAAIEAGILRAPALAEDLRSRSFVDGVFVPLLQITIDDPSRVPDANRLASDFVEMFVARFAASSTTDETLVRIFQTEPTQLVSAFSEIISALRSKLYSSEFWREAAHMLATEKILSDTGAIRAFLEGYDRANSVAAIDIQEAKEDAKRGSTELRNWPRDIAGLEIDRPELERLKRHIDEADRGTALLIGEAGSGKSALLARLTEDLERAGHVVFGIKADTLPASVQTIDDIGKALGLHGPLSFELAALAENCRVTLIIDQLDAVSDVMDRSSERMRLLLRLVKEIEDQALPVQVVVSSRPFEAAHDARFQRLKAEEFTLNLPSVGDVTDALKTLGIDVSKLAEPLVQTLRRPFALKLFVQLIQRGVEPASVRSSELLDRWLATADLGPDDMRVRALAVMTKLAEDMLETETLWRPLDQYEPTALEALARCEACGLLVRSGNKIGFNHQSWLDDFQARSFRTGADLAEYAWRNQDSLFVRATVLRSLERLRLVDFEAYARSINTLLWSDKTRRHLKHLLTDVISTARAPDQREGAWIDALIRQDPVLANRGLGRLGDHWADWRPFLSHSLRSLMKNDQFHWRAVQLLASEARIDPDLVVRLLAEEWNDASKDALVFRIAEQSGVLTPDLEKLLKKIMARTEIEQYSVSHFVTTLHGEGRHREAARLIAAWLSTGKFDRHHGPHLHDVEKLVDEAPLEYLEEVGAWFVEFAATRLEQYREGVKRYPKSTALPWDLDFSRGQGRIIEGVGDALQSLAKANPSAAMPLMQRWADIEIEQVQEIVARAYTVGASTLSEEALDYLLGDERRFQLGDASVEIEPGCSTLESGLTSQELVAAISPLLPPAKQTLLRDRIEAWSLYTDNMGKDDPPSLRRERLGWIDDNRKELLERLPSDLLSARRRRQVAEWRKSQGRQIPKRSSHRAMATLVGSPMSHASMAAAKDDDIMKMLSEVHDSAPERTRRRAIASDGGVTQLAQAFAAFGKDHPERAVNLALTKFAAGKHEHAAGYLVEEISKDKEGTEEPIYPPSLVHKLILDLSARGFCSRTWKTFASWALSRLSGQLKGLPDPTIALLESWLENEQPAVDEKIHRRLDNEAHNDRLNKKEKTQPEPLLFSRYGGMRIVPQDNYSILAAMFHGLLGRDNPDHAQWMDILERHARKPEDPHIWTFLLADKGRWLAWADLERVQALLSTLWSSDKRVFMSVDIVGFLWSQRKLVPSETLKEIMTAWFDAEEASFGQAAAELVQALGLIFPDDHVSAALSGRMLTEPSPELTGQLFSAAAAWREDDSDLRARSHKVLLQFVDDAAGDQAHAISAAVDRHDRLVPDPLTIEMIEAIAANTETLAASLTGRFADGLQSLLFYPGFDEAVMKVTETVANLIADQQGGHHRSFIDGDFVVAIR